MTRPGRIPTPLPVTSSGWTLSDVDGELVALPSVLLDARGRPDVADLARVHAIEGIGDIRTLATASGDTGIRFDVVVMSPVRCHLAFVISFADTAILEDIVRSGLLVLATRDQAEVGGVSLAVNIDGETLATVLAQ